MANKMIETNWKVTEGQVYLYFRNDFVEAKMGVAQNKQSLQEKINPFFGVTKFNIDMNCG